MKALLLEGGGAKGAYQAGAIKALCKKGLYFDAAGGTSIGAINAAFYVERNLNAMYKLWLGTGSKYLLGIDDELLDGLSDGDISKDEIAKSFDQIKKIIKNKGIDTTNIKKILSKNIKEDRFMRSKIDFGMNSYSLSDKEPVFLMKRDIKKGKLIETILSSAYLPFFKFEKIVDDKYYVDGGVYSNCPVDMFIDEGYDEILVIRNWRNKKLKFKHKKGVKVGVITPNEDLGSIVRFTKVASIYRMNLGYYDTIKFLDGLDGNKYYFKNYSNDYYNNLFTSRDYKELVKEYNRGLPPKSKKEFIIKILEQTLDNLEFERFKIYNIPYLITRLKYKLVNKKNNKYYNFIKNIKVDFE